MNQNTVDDAQIHSQPSRPLDARTRSAYTTIELNYKVHNILTLQFQLK